MSQSMSAAFSKEGFERKREEGNVRHDKKTNRNILKRKKSKNFTVFYSIQRSLFITLMHILEKEVINKRDTEEEQDRGAECYLSRRGLSHTAAGKAISSRTSASTPRVKFTPARTKALNYQ